MIALRTVKNPNFMSNEELIETLKVHELELQQDEGLKKGKSLALKPQKSKASSTCKESSSKFVNIDTPSNDESNDEGSNEDKQ